MFSGHRNLRFSDFTPVYRRLVVVISINSEFDRRFFKACLPHSLRLHEGFILIPSFGKLLAKIYLPLLDPGHRFIRTTPDSCFSILAKRSNLIVRSKQNKHINREIIRWELETNLETVKPKSLYIQLHELLMMSKP